MNLLLAPHNDDAELFACWHLLRERTHVIIVLRSIVQEQRGGPTAAQREAETAAAMKILGCTWEQWGYPDDMPNWERIRYALDTQEAYHDFETVYAPAVEPDGHEHHNQLGQAAHDVFGRFGEYRIVPYLTYTTGGKSEWGTRVPYQPEWVPLKLAALACYRSQAGLANCSEHFLRGLHEYVA